MRHAVSIAVSLTVAGCVTTTTVAGPSGSEDQLIRCTDTSECYDEAKELCGGPYQIIDSGNRNTSSGNGAAAFAMSWHEMVVHCGQEQPSTATPIVKYTTSSEPKAADTAPVTAAGFTFGQSADDARAACEGAHLEWKAGSISATCTGTPVDTGMNARARLGFCDNELCRVDVLVPPAEGTGVADNVMRTLTTLQKRYGDSTEHDVLYGQTCTGVGLPDCLTRGAAHFWYEWRWTGGKKLTVTLGPRKPHPRDADVNPTVDVTMRIRYDDGRFVKRPRDPAKAASSGPAKSADVDGL